MNSNLNINFPTNCWHMSVESTKHRITQLIFVTKLLHFTAMPPPPPHTHTHTHNTHTDTHTLFHGFYIKHVQGGATPYQTLQIVSAKLIIQQQTSCYATDLDLFYPKIASATISEWPKCQISLGTCPSDHVSHASKCNACSQDKALAWMLPPNLWKCSYATT